MKFVSQRVHVEEVLDSGSGGEPEVRASLADLRRINRVLGGRRVLLRLLGEHAAGLREFSVLDVATGSADLPAAVARRWPQARIVAIDVHLRHLREARTNRVRLACADALHPPFAPRSFDFVTVSLFLHHFAEPQAAHLLRSLAMLARRAVIVNDLDRHWLPYYFIHAASPLFARSAITRFDAPASIQRGFAAGELERIARAAGFHHFRARWHVPFRRSLVVRL